MAFDFPNSPTDGQTYAPAGGPAYVWQEGVWKAATDSDAAAAGVYDTVAALAAANVPANIKRVSTRGYYAVGDGGGATYVRSSSAPVFRTSNGGTVKWQNADRHVFNVRQYGAVGDGTVGLDQAAFDEAWAEACANHGTMYLPATANPETSSGYRANINARDEARGVKILGDGWRTTIWTHASIATPTLSAIGNENTAFRTIWIESVSLRSSNHQFALYLSDNVDPTLVSVECISGAVIEATIFTASFCSFYGNDVYPGLRLGHDNANSAGPAPIHALTGTGQGSFTNCSFLNSSSATNIPGLQILGNVFGVTFISCGFSGKFTSRTCTIDGPTTPGLDPWQDVTFIDCHGESNFNAANDGCDFAIGETAVFGQISFFGGNYFGQGNGVNYRQDCIRLYRCKSIVVDNVIATKLLSTNGYTRSMIRAEPGWPAAGDQWRFENLVPLRGIPAFSDGNTIAGSGQPPLFTGLAASKGIAGKVAVDTDSYDLVSRKSGAAAGPALALFRNKIAAVNDTIGQFQSDMLNDAGARTTLFRITPLVTNAVAGAEAGTIYLVSKVAGVDTIQAEIRTTGWNNMSIGAATPKDGRFTTLRVDQNIVLPNPVTKTANFTLAATENHVIVNMAGVCTATLGAGIGTSRELWIKNIGAGTVVSNLSNITPLGGGAAGTAILAAGPGKWALLAINGTGWEIMAGN